MSNTSDGKDGDKQPWSASTPGMSSKRVLALTEVDDEEDEESIYHNGSESRLDESEAATTLPEPPAFSTARISLPGAFHVRPGTASPVDSIGSASGSGTDDVVESQIHVSEGLTDDALQSELRNRVLDDALTPVAVEKVVDHHPESSPRRRQRIKKLQLCFLLLLAIAVVGLILGLVFGLRDQGARSGDSSSPGDSSASNTPGEEETRSGTDTMSQQGTLPTSNAASVAEQFFIQAIEATDLWMEYGDSFSNTRTAHAFAATWVCQPANEEACLDPESHERLFELFALVVFLYKFALEARLPEIVDFNACSFPGLVCQDFNGTRRVTELDFSGQNLVSRIVDEFGFFSRMQRFDMSNNPGVFGTIPSVWGDPWRNSIVSLNLSFTGLQGSFPSKLVGGTLEVLHIEGSDISGMDFDCSTFIPTEFSANCLFSGVGGGIDGLFSCSCCTECCDSNGMNCQARNMTM